MSLDFDFFVNDLGFNLNVTKDTPYERATAQFRKDQVDQGSTVGDQSLTGWWTRGQLSFHKGAGENYYEVSDGDTVLNRYKDSNGIEPFDPGEVTLMKSLDDLSVAATDAVPAPLDNGGGVYTLTSSGVVYTSGVGTTSFATSDAAVPTDITTSGTSYYVANNTYIERQSNGSLSQTNHVTNPSFETGTTGWTLSGGVPTSTTRAKYGTHSLNFRNHPTVRGSATATISGLTPGTTYRISAWAYMESAGAGVGAKVNLKFNGAAMGSATTFDSWVRITSTYLASATSHDLYLENDRTSGNYPESYVDAIMVTEEPYTSDYFDGSLPGVSWTGTANASKSTYSIAASTASTVRVALSGSTWSKVWWAKGRLFAVDAAGYFYALADAVATVDNTDSFWNSQRTGVHWSLTDSPGAVYISDGSNIYAITVSTDGLVPTLDTPTTVAQLPAGETISSIAYYLGNLVVATTAGVRVALVQDSQVFLGPLVIEGDFSDAGRIGCWNTKAYVVGRPEDRSGNYVLCAIDLSQKVTDLVYGWAPMATVCTNTSTANGATVDATGRVYVWSGLVLRAGSRDDLTTSGYVTTAYHRFGTLDGKNFASVLVRTAGEGGTVAVARIDADGTETTLSTITVPAAESTVVDLGLTAATERIALKFTLSRDTDTTRGPTLLGYQLRALPAPQRQRMIRVPLMLFDAERNRSGQKFGGSASDRLAALEALEESSAVVTFEDKIRGETGTAFVEAVEFTAIAPASSSRESFGGLLYVTLRRL